MRKNRRYDRKRRIDNKGRKGDNQVLDITGYKAEPKKEAQEPPYLVEKVLIPLMWQELFGRTLTG